MRLEALTMRRRGEWAEVPAACRPSPPEFSGLLPTSLSLISMPSASASRSKSRVYRFSSLSVAQPKIVFSANVFEIRSRWFLQCEVLFLESLDPAGSIVYAFCHQFGETRRSGG